MHMVIINHSCSFSTDRNRKISNFGEFKECLSDRRTDRPTDKPSYRDARTHLKNDTAIFIDTVLVFSSTSLMLLFLLSLTSWSSSLSSLFSLLLAITIYFRLEI